MTGATNNLLNFEYVYIVGELWNKNRNVEYEIERPCLKPPPKCTTGLVLIQSSTKENSATWRTQSVKQKTHTNNTVKFKTDSAFDKITQ